MKLLNNCLLVLYIGNCCQLKCSTQGFTLFPSACPIVRTVSSLCVHCFCCIRKLIKQFFEPYLNKSQQIHVSAGRIKRQTSLGCKFNERRLLWIHCFKNGKKRFQITCIYVCLLFKTLHMACVLCILPSKLICLLC